MKKLFTNKADCGIIVLGKNPLKRYRDTGKAYISIIANEDRLA